MSGPQTYNDARCNEISREVFCKFANKAAQLVEEQIKEDRVMGGLAELLVAIGEVMDSCSRAFLITNPDLVSLDD